MKYDNGKVDLSLIPSEALVEIATVLGFGAKKYGRYNHRLDAHETEWSRTYASIQRHLSDFWAGEDLDPESGQKHLTHAITQCIILLMQINDGHTNMDDRFSTRTKQKPNKLEGKVEDIRDLDTNDILDEMKNSQKRHEPTPIWNGPLYFGDYPNWPTVTEVSGTKNDISTGYKVGDTHASLYYNNETFISAETQPEILINQNTLSPYELDKKVSNGGADIVNEAYDKAVRRALNDDS